MNSKKKHKNRPKPTSNAAAIVETEVIEKKVEDVLPKSDVKEEIPTVAAAPDVAEVTPMVESVDTDNETPKKPKRKGKKKNQDKENVDKDTLEKTQGDVTIQSEVLQTEKQVANEGDVKELDKNKSAEACVAPSTRKKNTKKKSQEQAIQQAKVPEKECLPVSLEEKNTETQKNNQEIKDDVPLIAEETKPDTKSKKKNKKKKRNDSEKSDKAEELTCTSAFQQLLMESIEGDKPSEEAEIKPEGTQTKNDSALTNITENLILEGLPKSSDIKTTEESLLMKTLDKDEAPLEENKNRKKNKKDKKHMHAEQQIEFTPTAQEETKPQTKQVMDLIQPFTLHPVTLCSPKPTCEVVDEVKSDIDLLDPLKTPIEKEPSPKPKAKIAKPVEKKRKTHQEEPAMEALEKSTESSVMNEKVELKRPVTPLENVEIKMTEEEKATKVEPIIEQQNVLIDTINVPDRQPHDKKRKKSPKPPKHQETTEIKEESAHKTKQTKIEQEPKAVLTDLIKHDEEKALSGSENVTFTMCDESFIPLQKSEKTEISPPIDDVPPLLEIEVTNIPESKVGKKKKKTPKFPVVSETAEAKEIKQLITPDVIETEEIPKVSEPSTTEKVSESLAAPLSDIEIQSVKTDESGSSCDATPDVFFIRASSHQLVDRNNNMIIQEVRNLEDTKLNEPLIKPLVQGSGETSSGTPDLVSSGIQMTETQKTGKEEPTYLKSKMMEVNQDMEELRLSIERSLAEFSAIEKTEEKAEKDYESHRIECEKTFAELDVPKLEEPKASPAEQEKKATEPLNITEAPPVCPARKDNKGKSKSKKKGKQEATPVASSTSAAQSESTSTDSKDGKDKREKQEKTEQKTESTETKGKQQSESTDNKSKQANAMEQETYYKTDESNNLPILEQTFSDSLEQLDFAPIEHFEDAMTSSIDDVNKSFEMIVNNNEEESQKNLAANKPEINIIAPVGETEPKKGTNKKDDKVNPVSQPKNFLGHNDIPAQSNRTDYKKEKNKTPNERQAKVKIKDAMDVEAKKQSKESQTDIKRLLKIKDSSEKETFSRVKNDNEEYVYKYSFRKVFLQSACHVCHKELIQRVPCSYCNLVFYCGAKHKDEDWAQHQALCFAVSTIVHLKDQKHIYADAQNITGQEYRLLRMQMIVSCEKVLKRRLVPWEQEAMLYPRMCGDVGCREWRQSKLKDCEGCGQLSYCADQPPHLPKSHQRWCKSYHLYSKLVGYQQTRGRLEPRLPTKMGDGQLAEKMNEVLAAMYEEKIDINDIQYAALTQQATAPLTAAYCYQLCMSKMNHCNGVYKKTSFTIHVVGAELQFEADALNKWEVFFLHLRPDVEELRVVLISPVLNPGDLPLDLLGNIRLCDHCRQNKRRVVFSFQDKKNYSEYRSSEEFVSPKLVCAFNPSIQRSSVYSGKDPWPNTINCIIKQKVPFIITGYTITELRKDIARIKECSEVDFRVISEPVFNNFASVRPDRNFISDDEMPLLFKNYCVSVLCGC